MPLSGPALRKFPSVMFVQLVGLGYFDSSLKTPKNCIKKNI